MSSSRYSVYVRWETPGFPVRLDPTSQAALEFPDDRGVQREALPRPWPDVPSTEQLGWVGGHPFVFETERVSDYMVSISGLIEISGFLIAYLLHRLHLWFSDCLII